MHWRALPSASPLLRLEHLSEDDEDSALPLQYDFGGYMDSPSEGAESPVGSVGASRKLMEQVARESVAAVDNIHVCSGSFVTGLSMSGSDSAVKGMLPPDLSVPYGIASAMIESCSCMGIAWRLRSCVQQHPADLCLSSMGLMHVHVFHAHASAPVVVLQQLYQIPTPSEDPQQCSAKLSWALISMSGFHLPYHLANTGVQLKGGEEVDADFVVDASGRSSQLPQWLSAIGFEAPPQECISAGLGYGSRTYKMPDNWYQEKVGLQEFNLVMKI